MPNFNISKDERATLEAVLSKIGSNDTVVAKEAGAEFAKALEVPIRETLLSGDIYSDIFTVEDYAGKGRSLIEYPVDMLTPGQEGEFYAYVIPTYGAIPQKRVEADYLAVPTYEIGNSIDATRRFVKDASWDVISRMIEIMQAGVVKKINDDAFQTLIYAAFDRNLLISDPNAAQGEFTPRLITFMKSFMTRNGGGNTSTLNRSRLTDLYMSLEALDDVRSWNLDKVSDDVRTNIYYSSDEGNEIMKVYNVNLHELVELGEGQEYQLYYTSTLGGTMSGNDLEIVIGLDKSKPGSFVMPMVEPWQMYEDATVHRQRLVSFYGWMQYGMAVLDSRRVLLGSF